MNDQEMQRRVRGLTALIQSYAAWLDAGHGGKAARLIVEAEVSRLSGMLP